MGEIYLRTFFMRQLVKKERLDTIVSPPHSTSYKFVHTHTRTHTHTKCQSTETSNWIYQESLRLVHTAVAVANKINLFMFSVADTIFFSIALADTIGYRTNSITTLYEAKI